MEKTKEIKKDKKEKVEKKDEDWADMISVREDNDEKNQEHKIDETDGIFNKPDNKISPIATTGIKAILHSSVSSYERLPMLDIVFDRLVRISASSFRNVTQDNVEVFLESVESIRLGEYLDSLTVPSMISIFKADEWDGYGLTSIDSDLVYSLVDVLLGGRRGTAAIRTEGRAYTTIELNLIKDIVTTLLNDLSVAFEPVTAINFSYDRLETNPKFAAITRFSNPVIIASLRVDMEDRGGKLDIVIPYSTLDPIKEYLQQLFIGERYGRDIIWENYLADKLWDTELELTTIIKEKEVSLLDVSKWKKGSFLPLDMGPDDNVKVNCLGTPLFEANMGRKGNNIVIKIKGKQNTNE